MKLDDTFFDLKLYLALQMLILVLVCVLQIAWAVGATWNVLQQDQDQDHAMKIFSRFLFIYISLVYV